MVVESCGEVSIGGEGIVACSDAAGAVFSLTELARNATRIATDVKAVLGSEQVRNQVLNVVESRIPDVDGRPRGLCRSSVVCLRGKHEALGQQLPDRLGFDGEMRALWL